MGKDKKKKLPDEASNNSKPPIQNTKSSNLPRIEQDGPASLEQNAGCQGINAVRISNRINKGIPPNLYGFERSDFNETPFVIGTSTTINPVSSNFDDSLFNDISLFPQGESTIISNQKKSNKHEEESSNSVEQIQSLFKEFQINMLKCFSERDKALCTELKNVQCNLDDKFDHMMNLIDKNNTDIKLLQQEKIVAVSEFQNVVSNTVDLDRCSNQAKFHLPPPPTVTSTATQNASGNNITQTSTNDINHRKKLYDLPIFDGTPETWPLFYTSFNETTLAYTYSNLENSVRLRKCLSGPALETVHAMLIHPENVPEIIDELKFRFGRPEILVKSQIDKIRQIPRIKDDDLSELINFSTKMRNLVSFLRNADAEQYFQNPYLLEELLHKLPLQRRLDWASNLMTISGSPSLKDFTEWISRIAKVASLIEPTMPSSNTTTQNKSSSKQRSMVTNEVKQSIKCFYCQEPHVVHQCKKFINMPVIDRWIWVKKTSVCFCCLRKGHRIQDCRQKKQCGVESCRLKHHSLLHEKNKSEQSSKSEPVQSVVGISTALNCNQPSECVYFRVLPITLYGGDKKVSTFALFDEGSSMTIMEADLMDELNLNARPTKLSMQWLNDGYASDDTRVADCEIQGANVDVKYMLKNVYAWKNLKLPIQSINVNELISSYPQLKGLPIKSFKNARPRILIGLNNARLGFARSWIDCPPSGPIAVETCLGWMLYGPTANTKTLCDGRVMIVNSSFDDNLQMKYNELNEIVKNYYDSENFGVKVPEKVLHSNELVRANNLLEKTTKFNGICYESGLLWKTDNVIMPNSYNMALHRLQNLEKKLSRDPEYNRKYCKAMDEFVIKNYARKLTDSEASCITNKSWYLPHFGVININKPDKIRIVFDAAAVVDGVSLNSKLLKGPDLNQPLLSVLSQFREKPVAVCGDIQEMFCQVKIIPEDCVAQRFLWRDGDVSMPISVYEMTSMIFGATSSPTTAQYVKNFNAMQFKDHLPEAVQAVIQNHYVDDYVKSFDDEDTAVRISKQVRDIHKSANFILRNFSSNSSSVKKQLSSDIISIDDSVVNFNVESGVHTEKVLGMFWDNVTDKFIFKFKFNKLSEEVLKQCRPPTKREVLSMTMSIFDPFGFLTNLHIYAKILLQSLWNFSMSWDDPLPDDIAAKWYHWQSKLDDIKNISIPRCYFNFCLQSNDHIELHIFVDASIEAYAAVSYWRVVQENNVQVAFVYGKSRVAPRKMLSIPRMELQASVLGIRMKESILSSHSIKPSRIYYWTDSKTVLQWINSDSRIYKPFVGHRIAEIVEFSNMTDWFWIPTKMNVADEATRASYPINIENHNWLHGPSLLYESDLSIPEQPIKHDNVDKIGQEEIRPSFRVKKLLIAKSTTTMSLVNINHFSSYLRLKRVVAWVYRAVNLFLKKTKLVGELTANELNIAEYYLCRIVQREVFNVEYNSLKDQHKLLSDSELFNLTPYIDEHELLRVHGRIDAANIVPISTRRPIIIPKNHMLTKLIIAHYHELFLHGNSEAVIGKIREKFWIPHIRQQLKSVTQQCQRCKISKAKPRQPMMGPLPYDRLAAYVRPFTFTGLDYFGPVNVSIGRRREKRWVAVFTCLTIRAIHLEIAANLSTDACILCLRNFFNIRGVPKRIRSDNGTNFLGINKELTNVPDFLDIDEIQRKLSGFGIEWYFNSPYDPSAGGVWERLVQSVKRSLNATLAERVPREETLRSLLLEAANIINSRPLTHVPVNSDEEEPLTPNHFLIGDVNSTQTPGEIDEHLICMRKQWRISQQLKNHFYKRWISEYLPILIRRSKWFEKAPPLQVGQLVLICEVDLPRSKWIRGRIVKTYVGKDNQVRTAEVKTSNGLLRRPANRLAVLDIANLSDSREGECRGENST